MQKDRLEVSPEESKEASKVATDAMECNSRALEASLAIMQAQGITGPTSCTTPTLVATQVDPVADVTGGVGDAIEFQSNQHTHQPIRSVTMTLRSHTLLTNKAQSLLPTPLLVAPDICAVEQDFSVRIQLFFFYSLHDWVYTFVNVNKQKLDLSNI